ncbi:SRPBCC family protein [Micromonospora sp. ALFpr18c]|uniref:SRPBCC family protein n=1 Tax=Micromonospora sp. ALFpr18c TaxID=1458665 RepID=UPI00124AF956|nr:SRPBCC family protein [Micromonospora sp. ALFpr18c]KAB1926361.1 SRPBCC family protein [Micromonospora sp. ALFpr18c]
MLRRDTFSYTVQARCAPAEAAALLSDLTRQGELHPLIVSVQRLPPRSGALASYAISDRLQAGPLRFRTTYQADVLINEEDEIVMVARQRPATTVRNHTRLRAEPDGLLRVDVEITLSAPAPLFRYAFRQARAAHLALASRLGAALDRAGNPPPAT